MERIVISILCLAAVTKIHAQKETGIPGMVLRLDKGSAAYTVEGKELQTGNAFILTGGRPENQRLKATLSFRPDKKTSARLSNARFESLVLEYLVKPEGSESPGKSYLGRLQLGTENLMDEGEYFATHELFSFADYDWEWEKIPWGARQKKVEVSIYGIYINDTEYMKLPDLFHEVKFSLKVESFSSRYKDLCEVLLKRSMYPNKEGFDILFNSNPKFFYENKNELKPQDFARLKLPGTEVPNVKRQEIQKYVFQLEKLKDLKFDLDSAASAIKQDKVFDRDADAVKRLLREVSDFLSWPRAPSLEISQPTGQLLLGEISTLIKLINAFNASKTKLSKEHTENFEVLINDVAATVRLLSRSSKAGGSIQSKTRNPLARLVANQDMAPMRFSDDISVHVVVNTSYGKPYEKFQKGGYYIKCAPWARRKEPADVLKADGVLWTFPFPSTPTNQLLPVATYCFWVEDSAGNRMQLDNNDKWGEPVKIRPTADKLTTWLLRLINSEVPFAIWLGLKPA